jgi:hypothetical protein
MMQRIILLSFIFLISLPTIAGETIATNTWELEAPEKWSINYDTEPAKLLGPAGEVVLLTAKDFPLADISPEAKLYRERLEKIALQVMSEGARKLPLIPESEIKSIDLSEKVRFHQITSSSSEDESILAQFCIIGPKALLIITYDSSSMKESLKEIRKSLINIKWAI